MSAARTSGEVGVSQERRRIEERWWSPYPVYKDIVPYLRGAQCQAVEFTMAGRPIPVPDLWPEHVGLAIGDTPEARAVHAVCGPCFLNYLWLYWWIATNDFRFQPWGNAPIDAAPGRSMLRARGVFQAGTE